MFILFIYNNTYVAFTQTKESAEIDLNRRKVVDDSHYHLRPQLVDDLNYQTLPWFSVKISVCKRKTPDRCPESWSSRRDTLFSTACNHCDAACEISVTPFESSKISFAGGFYRLFRNPQIFSSNDSLQNAGIEDRLP